MNDKNTSFNDSVGWEIIHNWMKNNDRKPFTFQRDTWKAIEKGYSGMVIAPTGFGKTFSVFIGVIIHFLNHPNEYKDGLKLIWVTPLRSLANDLAKAMQEAINDIGLDWVVETRNGDTDIKIKQRQSKSMPEVLILTPESLHLLLAQKGRTQFFKNLKCIAIDEWHELLSTKRGVMIELAIAYLKYHYKDLLVWGITATIGNVDEAQHVLLPKKVFPKQKSITATEKKKIKVVSVYPEDYSLLPWAGHLGAKMSTQVVEIINKSKTTLIFTNTRNQSEMWYQLLLDTDPNLAGIIALHHGSIDAAIRQWIEEALSEGRLKAVVATSSLDLGVDFKSVDTVIQIGSSKGVARFVQRAGRSGHTPHALSTIYFVPTHTLELMEAAALKQAVAMQKMEDRVPMVMTFDVLVQFLVTIALGGGFKAEEMYELVQYSNAFQYMELDEWHWCLMFITVGGKIGEQYEEYHKVVKNDEHLYIVDKRRIGMIHRMNIGVIVSDAMLRVKFLSGGYIGMVEEYFISKLKLGDKFILAGRTLELSSIKDMTVYVKAAKGKGITPSWVGGRLPLTSNLSELLRQKVSLSSSDQWQEDEEISFLSPMLDRQENLSHIPLENEFLVEMVENKEGSHLFFYPFEGKIVHEVMASVIAYRISQQIPISFTIATNDYGFELFSDTHLELSVDNIREILSNDNLMVDVIASINATEMAKRKFRDIAVIAGYVVQNSYGRHKSNKSLQSSAGIIFNTLEEYDKENLLLRQAYNEVFDQQLEEPRLRASFKRISESVLVYKKMKQFSPLSFPIKVDSLRQSLSSEDLATRIQKLMQQSLK